MGEKTDLRGDECMSNSYFKNNMDEILEVQKRLMASDEVIDNFAQVVAATKAAFDSGKKVMLAGNGGSAADAQHIAGEFVSRFEFDRPGLASVALTTDTSILTAIGNDYGYQRLFSRQIEALGREGDLFYCYSTSGNSPNILDALSVAKRLGIKTVGFTGLRGGKMDSMCDYIFRVPSKSTPRIQEGHLKLGHLICGEVEGLIFPEYKEKK